MADRESEVYISDIDEARFGYKTAKAVNINCNNFSSLLGFCKENSVELLIARCDPRETKTIHNMEQNGFLLMETLIYYMLDLKHQNLSNFAYENFKDPENLNIRHLQKGEEKIVENIARKAFTDHVGHYHMDERLDDIKCTEVYASWAYNCCKSRKFADQVFVALINDSVVGFAVLKKLIEKNWQGVLMGVLPGHHSRGIGKALTIERIKYCLAKKGQSLNIPVSINNVSVQKTLQKLNFRASYFEYTFHKWFI